MEISVFDSDRHTPAIRRALVAEGHDVLVVVREDDLTSCDLVVLDAAAWSERAVDRLVTRLPHAEFLLLVDDARRKPPSDAVMTLVKPVDVNKLIRLARVVAEARHGRSDARDLVDFETLFSGDSPAMIELLRRVGLLAHSDAPVWLHGELGSGRAVVARAIHERSSRQGRMFMAVNAASFPGDLLEEHLFGGLEPQVLRVASGTLFIDSVTELAPGVQAKLLRLLEDGGCASATAICRSTCASWSATSAGHSTSAAASAASSATC